MVQRQTFCKATVTFLLAALSTACGEAKGGVHAGGRSAAPDPMPNSDSAYLRDVAAFRQNLPAPAELDGGAASVDALIERFVAAVEAGDTAELARLVLGRAEFAHLYYPHTRFTRPPYRMTPALLWFLIQNNSSKGVHRLLQRRGEHPLGYEGHACPSEVLVEGPNRILEGCRVFTSRRQTPQGQRLFGSILERDGRFKFLSYANEF